MNFVHFFYFAIGKVDHLVNNAGIACCAPLLDFDLDDFDKVMKINTRTALQCIQLASKSMISNSVDAKTGSINASPVHSIAWPGGGVHPPSRGAADPSWTILISPSGRRAAPRRTSASV